MVSSAQNVGNLLVPMVYPVNHWCLLHQEGLSLHRILIAVYSPLSWSPGSLIQVPSVEKGKLSKVRLGSLSLKKEGERQCFLFTKHFLICTRSSGGKLHLLKVLVLHYFIYVSRDIQVNLIVTFQMPGITKHYPNWKVRQCTVTTLDIHYVVTWVYRNRNVNVHYH